MPLGHFRIGCFQGFFIILLSVINWLFELDMISVYISGILK
jgi:hypothetical protein